MTRQLKPSCCDSWTNWDSMAWMPVVWMSPGDSNPALRSTLRISTLRVCDAGCLRLAENENQNGVQRRADLPSWQNRPNYVLPGHVRGSAACLGGNSVSAALSGMQRSQQGRRGRSYFSGCETLRAP